MPIVTKPQQGEGLISSSGSFTMNLYCCHECVALRY
jgi:hypothetical protein